MNDINKNVQYHNDLNNTSLGRFPLADWKIFHVCCGFLNDKLTKEIEIKFLDLKQILSWEKKSNKLLIKNLISLQENMKNLNWNYGNDNPKNGNQLFFINDINEKEKTFKLKINPAVTYILNPTLHMMEQLFGQKFPELIDDK